MQKIKNKDITVWFSCGAASAVAAKGRDLKSYDFECGIFCAKGERNV